MQPNLRSKHTLTHLVLPPLITNWVLNLNFLPFLSVCGALWFFIFQNDEKIKTPTAYKSSKKWGLPSNDVDLINIGSTVFVAFSQF